ncbi:Protein of unknown function [Pyronema omphalodes CBS 100304]|uniref:Uncharacterized protein n=1 Tax=Pyronema omphalodes (strain CBS 100304) TaxID=1076935 RepID=U4KZU7_PYROM|nr:Protein of unknown function [Pyronema omphalodes CBS 100304]
MQLLTAIAIALSVLPAVQAADIFMCSNSGYEEPCYNATTSDHECIDVAPDFMHRIVSARTFTGICAAHAGPNCGGPQLTTITPEGQEFIPEGRHIASFFCRDE